MMLIRISNFFKSLFFHISRGLPKSTKEQILQRYEICNKCSEFDLHNSMCNVCGCNISNKKEFFNKLAWADQKCPIDKWQRVAT